MKPPALRLLFSLVLLASVTATSRAQLLLTIDWSNLSAVKVTATSNAPAYSYNNNSGEFPDTPVWPSPLGSSYKGEDGFTLINFLTSPSATTGSNVGPGASSSTLTDYSGASIYDQFYVISAAQGGSPNDLTIFANNTSSPIILANGHPAFTGQAVFDLSGGDWSDLVNQLPTVGATGNITFWNETSFSLGTWEVTGSVSAVPEPSTYAAILGGLALVGVMLRRRLAARS